MQNNDETDNNVVFKFSICSEEETQDDINNDEDKQDEQVLENNKKFLNLSNKKESKNKNEDNKSNKSEGISFFHIKNIDIYDKKVFEKENTKRKSNKGKTQICSKKKFTIEKFTDEIMKITEDMPKQNSNSKSPEKLLTRGDTKKRTIRFADKKVTYQYPKGQEMLGLFDANSKVGSKTEDLVNLDNISNQI